MQIKNSAYLHLYYYNELQVFLSYYPACIIFCSYIGYYKNKSNLEGIMRKLYNSALAVAAATLVSFPVNAVEFDYGGYISVVGGATLNGDSTGSYLSDVLEYDCPCFIADYTDVGIYEDDGMTFKPDSGYGVNGQVSFTDWYSIAGQIEGKGGNDFEPEFTWLYMRFGITNSILRA